MQATRESRSRALVTVFVTLEPFIVSQAGKGQSSGDQPRGKKDEK
jgi:hypothetical protein